MTATADPEQFLYLTTRGRHSGLPREIEIWFTHHDNRYYVIAEYTTSQWVQNLNAHPEVRVRVAGNTFAAHARALAPGVDGPLIATIQGLSRQKYGWGEGLVVELTPIATPNPMTRPANKEKPEQQVCCSGRIPARLSRYAARASTKCSHSVVSTM